MTTKQKKMPAAKSCRRPRITKREKRIIEAWKDHVEGRVTDDDFFRDQRLVQTAAQYFTVEEGLAMLDKGELPRPYIWGTRFFDAEFLPIAAKAIHRRDAMLKPHVEQLARLMPEILADYDVTPEDVKLIISRLRKRIDEYSGPPVSEPFVWWAMTQVADSITSLRTSRKEQDENRIAFADVYKHGYRAAFAGVWEILRHCRHLGATRDVAEELVQVTMMKILCDIKNWRDGTASIPSRVRIFAEAQAMGWRTERIREKQRRGRLLGGVRRRRKELQYPGSAKKPSADAQNEL